VDRSRRAWKKVIRGKVKDKIVLHFSIEKEAESAL